jgi:predicted acyltransferase
MPLNKKLWTSTFAMFSAGIAILLLAGFVYVIDIRKVRRGWGFLLIFGTNAIFAYVLADLVAIALGFIRVNGSADGRPMTLGGLLYQRGFANWMQPYHASLAYAIVFVLVIAALVWPLYRRRIFLRI